MKCTPLGAGPLGTIAHVVGVDAALVWANATNFRDFCRPGADMPQQVPVVVELSARSSADALRADGAIVPSVHRGSSMRHVGAWFDQNYCRKALAQHKDAPVARFTLQLPVIPQRPRPLRDVPAPPVSTKIRRTRSKSSVLIGVIDCGCPFAHRMLRDAAGTATRVLHLWDQDLHAPAFVAEGAAVPRDFGYGAEVDRRLMNRLMSESAVPGDAREVNETLCYERAGYDVLRYRFGHGAAVLGLLVAPRPLDTAVMVRPGPSRPQRRDDAAAGADVVFVQLPRDAVQDSGSASIERCVIDGLDYILSCARPGQRVVVNISDGSSRGSHDGQSIVELAIAERVKLCKGRLHVVIAAGNSRDEERHAQFDRLKPGASARVWLRVPPGNETTAFVTVRLPPSARGLGVRVIPPGADGVDARTTLAGRADAWSHDESAAPFSGLVLPRPLRNRACTGLLAIAPTQVATTGQPSAPAGDWCIEVSLAPGAVVPDEPVHLWVSRSQRNATALARARQARFIDVDRLYDPQPHLRPLKEDPKPARSPIRRAGTLNSLATGARSVVVAGVLRLESEPALYSSAGPAAGPITKARAGPDYAAPVDESWGLRGMRVAGNRSGDAIRAIGTSFAAPQVARRLANGEPPTVVKNRDGDIRRVGKGVVPPDPP